MWSPFAESPPRSVAPASTSSAHQSERFGGIWMPDVRHQPLALLDQALDVVDRHRSRPARRLQQFAFGRLAVIRPPVARSLIGDVRHLAAVVLRVRNEVLEDDLLEVAVALVGPRQRFERFDALVLGLADADEDPAW